MPTIPRDMPCPSRRTAHQMAQFEVEHHRGGLFQRAGTIGPEQTSPPIPAFALCACRWTNQREFFREFFTHLRQCSGESSRDPGPDSARRSVHTPGRQPSPSQAHCVILGRLHRATHSSGKARSLGRALPPGPYKSRAHASRPSSSCSRSSSLPAPPLRALPASCHLRSLAPRVRPI
jgi:hypothetical protein